MENSNNNSSVFHVRREVYEAHTYIIDHFLEVSSWDDVAQQVGLSGKYLRKLYSDTYNQSLNRTLTELRMKYASDLLVTTSITVREISFLTNYHNVAYFCRRFREWSGMSPIEYRRKYTIVGMSDRIV